MRAGIFINLLLYPWTRDSALHVWALAMYFFNEWMNRIVMARWQEHMMDSTWTSFLLTPICMKLHSSPRPRVQPFTLVIFSIISCQYCICPKSSPGMPSRFNAIYLEFSMKPGEGRRGDSWFDQISQSRTCQSWSRTLREPISKTCLTFLKNLSGGFWLLLPLRLS